MSVKHNEKGAWPKVCIACADNGIETILNPGINCYLSLYKHIVKYKLPDFRAKKIEYLYNYHREEPAGIYAIYYDLDIIYIGESSLPEQRRIHHFTKHIKSKEQLDKGQWQSNIQYALATGELDRKRLSFEVMEYEQDKAKRLILEKKLIQEHFNTFGEYPKYQLNHTGVHNGKKRKE